MIFLETRGESILKSLSWLSLAFDGRLISLRLRLYYEGLGIRQFEGPKYYKLIVLIE